MTFIQTWGSCYMLMPDSWMMLMELMVVLQPWIQDSRPTIVWPLQPPTEPLSELSYVLAYKTSVFVSVVHCPTCQRDLSVHCPTLWLNLNGKADISANKKANARFLSEALALNLERESPSGSTWWSRWSRNTPWAGWDPSWWGGRTSAGLCILLVWLLHLENTKASVYLHPEQTVLLLWWWIVAAGREGTTADVRCGYVPVLKFLGILDFRKSAISLSSSFSLQEKIAKKMTPENTHRNSTGWQTLPLSVNEQSVKYTPNGASL